MIKSLTSLRGIFILFIFFHHCLHLYPGGGTMAVTFFFVLGGFSMTLGYKDKVLKSDFNYKSYLTKRCIKFYPLHWLCILAVLPLALLNNSELKQLLILFLNGALLQTWIPVKEFYFSFNWVSWYLADTMFFAMVFPLLFRQIVKASYKGRVLIALLFIAFNAIVTVLLSVEQYHSFLYVSPYMRLTDFVLGIYLALLYGKLKEQPPKWWNGCVVGQIIVFCFIALLVLESCFLPENATWIAPVYWFFTAAVILTASLIKSSERGGQFLLENKWLHRLGELSFIIFMIHQIILRYTTFVFDKILHFENDIVYIVLTFGLTIMISLCVEKYILKPITQWLTKRIQPSMTALS